MKRLSWIISIVFFLGLIAEGFYFNQAQKENAMLASPEHLQMQLLPTLNEMANNPNQQVEFTATIATIGPLIVEQAKKDPKRFSQFSTEIVRTAIKSDIGLALLFQDYADTQTKIEMAKIQEKYNTMKFSSDKLAEQEKQIADLQKENIRLQQVVKNSDNFTTQIADLKLQLIQIKNERDNFSSDIGRLQAEIVRFKKAQAAATTLAPALLAPSPISESDKKVLNHLAELDRMALQKWQEYESWVAQF